MNNVTGNQLAWLFLGIPAIIAWAGYGAGFLLEPHLTAEVKELLWAAYAVGGWYGLLTVCFGGWFVLLL